MDKQASYFLTDVVLMGGRGFTASSNDMYCEAKVAILSDGTSRIEAVFQAAAYLIENQEFMVIRPYPEALAIIFTRKYMGLNLK